MEQPGFWDDVAKSTSVSRQLKKLQDSLEEYQKLEQDFSDIETLIQMAEEEGDSSMIEEIGEMLTAFQKEFENYRISLLLSGEFDGYDAVMTLHAGAGGTESCDWTSMLYRMYTRWQRNMVLRWKYLTIWKVMRLASSRLRSRSAGRMHTDI